jgi:hypothetical protein
VGLQKEVEDSIHAGEVFLVFVRGCLGWVFEIVQFLRKGERRGVLAACVQQHIADVRKYYYCTINNLSPSHPFPISYMHLPYQMSFLSFSVFLVWK